MGVSLKESLGAGGGIGGDPGLLTAAATTGLGGGGGGGGARRTIDPAAYPLVILFTDAISSASDGVGV